MSIDRFILHCKMESRWVPHFLAMLEQMEQLGIQGRTQYVEILSDGQADFKPTFYMVDGDSPPMPLSGMSLPEPHRDIDGDTTFYAGRTDLPKHS